MNIKDFMIEHEGYRKLPYTDTVGVITIGVGFNLKIGLDDAEIDFILTHRIDRAEKDAINIVGRDTWLAIGQVRRFVLISMAYQLGYEGLRAFRKMIKALKAEDYTEASTEALDSKWAKQTPSRAAHHANLLKTGVEYESVD